MPLFNLPLDSSSTRPSARARYYPRTSKKRKRLSSPHVSFADEPTLSASDPAPEQPSLPPASTNPLSLNPDEVRQYKIAGLDLDQELPSKSIPDFPHRRLPPSFPLALPLEVAAQADDDGTETENENSQPETRAPHLRIHHLGVLTTILQRCILEGDIPKASRAWTLLLRTQHNGKAIDIRTSRYWGIGAELLIRGGEKPLRGQSALGDEAGFPVDGVAEESDSSDEGEQMDENRSRRSDRRWGTAYGLEKAKEYYERLIVQHPHTRQYHDSVNSMDFWPAMLSCEIYGVQFEQKEALRKVLLEGNSEDASMVDSSSEEDDDLRSDVPDTYFAARQRKEVRQRARRRDMVWMKRDQIRHTALVASEKIAARMDELMVTPPYSDSHVLLRLRGMLALYIGDLSVPDLFEAPSEQEDGGDDDDANFDMYDAVAGKLSEMRFLQRNRRTEHRRGLSKRSEENARAQKAFEKIQRDGGRIGVHIAGIMNADL